MTNQHEQRAREKKIRQISDGFHAVGISAEAARRMSAEQWETVRVAMRYNTLSDKTIDGVILRLEGFNAPHRMTVAEYRERMRAIQ